MEEVKCLKCSSSIDDEDCRDNGKYEGCDEDVSIWSCNNTGDTKVKEKQHSVLQCNDFP